MYRQGEIDGRANFTEWAAVEAQTAAARATTRVTRRSSTGKTPVRPAWRTGDKVLWQGYSGTFLRDTVDGQVEVLIGTRTYRVARGELQRA